MSGSFPKIKGYEIPKISKKKKKEHMGGLIRPNKKRVLEDRNVILRLWPRMQSSHRIQ